MKNKIIGTLFEFKSFIFDNISLSGTDVNLFFHRDKRKSLVCPHCGSLMGKNREIERTVYDLCLCSEKFLRITFKTYQGRCSNCGKTKTFLPDEVSEKMKVTKRLQLYAFKLCSYASAAEVAELFSCSDDTIRRWDMAILKEQYESVDLDNVRHILVDEKSIGKFHKYVTLVLNGETGELLYLHKGKGYYALKPFFEQMTQKQKENIAFACTDRNASYPKAIKEFCPNVTLVFDKFHIIKNLLDGVDQVRREETAKAVKENKPIIKGGRFNLLRNKDNLNARQYQSLSELLEINTNISAAYILKESFRQIWDFEHPQCAFSFLSNWVMQAVEGKLKPLVRFGQGLLKNKNELLASIQLGYTNALMERFNGTVALTIRKGYGYGRLDHLFLKLRQASLKIKHRVQLSCG